MSHKLLPFMTFERENFCLERTENFCETYGAIYTKDLLLSDDAQVNVEHFVVRHPDRALKVLKYGKQENIPVGCILPTFPVPGVGDWVDLPPAGCRLPPPDTDPTWIQTTPSLDANPPGHVTCDACWEVNPLPPVNRMTDRCKNITLPKNLFEAVIKVLMHYLE